MNVDDSVGVSYIVHMYSVGLLSTVAYTACLTLYNSVHVTLCVCVCVCVAFVVCMYFCSYNAVID